MHLTVHTGRRVADPYIAQWQNYSHHIKNMSDNYIVA